MPRLQVMAWLAALLVLATMRGSGQDRREPPNLVHMFAPPPIERGVSPVETRVPGSAAELKREAIRQAAVRDGAGASGARYLPGQVIVKFKDGSSAQSHIASLSAASRTASISTRPDYANFDVVQIDSGEDAEAVAQTLSERPDVEYAQAAYRIHTMFVPNDPYYKQIPEWNFPMIDMERAWDIQPAAGSSITVAVLDTGVSYTSATMTYQANAFTDNSGVHYPALGTVLAQFVPATDLITAGRVVAPHDFIWNTNLPFDLDGHGTHVSGTLGQLTNNGLGGAGVAFNVKIMPVKVIDSDWDDIFGSPNQGTDAVVAQGIRYAADNGAKVINMSIGRTGPPAPAVEDAMKYAVGKGVFIAVAAGNDYENGNPTEVLAEICSRVQGAVSVAAVDESKSHAYYSSTGSYIELSAPGGSFRGFPNSGGILQQTLDLDLVDTFDLPPSQYVAPRFDTLAYYYFIGTSQATPHVSGAAAMLMQQGITDPAAVEAALEATAADLGTAGRDSTFGFGLINVRNALRGLGLAR